MNLLCTPNTNDVENYIKKTYFRGKKILHIVPTLILFTRRKNFYEKLLGLHITEPLHNMSDREISDRLIDKNIYLFEFNRFLEYLVYNSQLDVLSKKESIIFLERLLRNNQETNNHAWLSTAMNIYEAFKLFSFSGLTKEKLSSFSESESWKKLIHIYTLYISELKSLKLFDFGMAVNYLINNFNERFDQVYFDGAFLPIEPQLHQLITILNKNENNIKFFIPFEEKNRNSQAFNVLKQTYIPYIPYEKWETINENVQEHNVVEKISRNIFSENNIRIDDNSVNFLQYETGEEEITDIVKKSMNLISRYNVNPNKIAIITPNSRELRPVVQELVELYGFNTEYSDRPLIQLPFGKFIYILYQIYIDPRIEIFNELDHYIDSDMMSDLLHIRMIKDTEQIIETYEYIKAFFVDSISFPNWFEQIEKLKKARENIKNEEYKYHPLYYVSIEQLNEFKELLVYIQNLSKRIINVPKTTFNRHLIQLLDILEQEDKVVEQEDDIIQRILEIIDSITSEDNLEISVYEFARIIHAVFQEIDENQENDINNVKPIKITVTGLNNVEYQEYDYIFLAQFTQNTYPNKINYHWPLSLDIEYQILKETTNFPGNKPEDLRLYYLDRFIYQLFIVLNATRRKITITYSNIRDGIKQTPAHYIHDIAKVFNLEEDPNSNITIEQLLSENRLLFKIRKENKGPIEKKIEKGQYLISENKTITIEDLATYEYCPRRFYYEKEYPETKVYTGLFDLQLYATACLYEKAIFELVKRYPNVGAYNAKYINNELDEIINRALNDVKCIFPISQRFWEDIIIRTKFHIESLINSILTKTDHKRADLSLDKGQYHKINVGEFTFTGKRELRVKYGTITHYYAISNLKELLAFSVKTNDPIEREYLQIVKRKYNSLLRNFLYQKKDYEKILSSYVDKFESQKFDKNSGAHCQYCPINNFCLEKEINKS